jgi:hypothetical protein
LSLVLMILKNGACSLSGDVNTFRRMNMQPVPPAPISCQPGFSVAGSGIIITPSSHCPKQGIVCFSFGSQTQYGSTAMLHSSGMP